MLDAPMKRKANKPAFKIDTADVNCPTGFTAGGLACGIKASGAPDLAVIVAENPVSAAGLFTRNLVRAAPIEISEKNLHAAKGRIRAVMISSGCANAATGEEGKRRAERTVRELASQLKCAPQEILVNSTGVIGEQLPDSKITAALPRLLKQAGSQGLNDAMRAIMTTDTRAKMVQITGEHEGRTFVVAGIAKGAGMIHPNMATMISVLMTDAAVEPAQLDSMLRRAADKSFHRISVDGDTSTNDSVFALASGAAGEFPPDLIEEALTMAARELAIMIVMDGEGASKLIHVRVSGARSQQDAFQVAQTVAGSMLVRTAIAGGDPNWGRIIAAAGRSGVRFDPARLTVRANGVPMYINGAPADTPLAEQQQIFQQKNLTLDLDLAQGDSTDEFFTCDLTEEYIRINSHYRT